MAADFYPAQSESFPSVAEGRSNLGAPDLIKPADWLRMFEAEGGVTGSILPELIKNTQSVTNLVQNTFKNQLDLQKAQADLDHTVANTDSTRAYADSIRQQSANRAELQPLIKKSF